MIRKQIWFLLAVLVLLAPLCSAGESRVFGVSETEPFGHDAAMLTVRAAPLYKADCMLITLGDLSMLVDSGTGRDVPAIRSMLREAGVDHIDLFFNSHPHSDHIGGFIVLADEGFPFGEFMTAFPEDWSGIAVQQETAVHTAAAHSIPVTVVRAGDVIPFGNAELTVLRVPDDQITAGMSVNDLSAMLLLRYGNCSILLTGDVELQAQAVLADMYDLKADICKFPHHGLSIMDDNFLKEIDPEYTFITSGAIRSLFGQISLRENGCHRLSFTDWGMITMQTDGTKWIVSQTMNAKPSFFTDWFLNVNPWIEPLP